MKSSRRALMLIFLIIILAVSAIMGTFWYIAGHMDRSGWIQRGGSYFYLDEKGDPITGWLEEEGARYYFGDGGAMATGWQTIEGGRFYFGASGVLATGWLEQNGEVRYFGADGTPASGWSFVDGERRYFLTDGLLATGWQIIDDSRYYLSEGGTMVTGWLVEPEGTYYLNESGHPASGLTTLDGQQYYFYNNSGIMAVGMVDLSDGCHYFGDDGVMATGWQIADGVERYFDENGVMVTGWLQLGEYRYYLLADGSKAVSPTEIDGETCFFTPDGVNLVLVNDRNPIPDSYHPEIVRYNTDLRVAAVAEQALRQMILDCRATGIECWLNCGYRTRDQQEEILRTRIGKYQGEGMSYEAALAEALKTVAQPGCSEHETGLAMDIVCSVTPTWLHEHCWEYGFILRYPEDKTDITHIEYEHWHFRYVGVEVSMAMKDTGLCLEEYLGAA